MSFIEYLIEKNYKPSRHLYKSGIGWYNEEEKYDVNFFSSCVPGYLDIWLTNGDKTIIYGLNEREHPPVLIYPRLGTRDADVDRVFMNNSYDEILSMIDNYFKNKQKSNNYE